LKAWVAGSCLAVLLVAALLAAPALVRGKVVREARARGFEAEVGGVGFGLGKVWVREVRLTAPGEDFELRLTAVAVSVFSGEVSAVGGALRGSGEPGRLLERLRSKGESASPPSDGGGGGRDVRLEGMYVRWQRGEEALEVFGARASRGAGAVKLGADLARVSDSSRSVAASGLVVELGQTAGRRHLKRVETRTLEVTLRGAPSEPVVAGARGEPTPGRASTSSRGERLKALRGVALPLLRQSLVDGASWTLNGVSAHVEQGAEKLSIGPSRLALSRRGDTVQVSLTPSATEAGRTPLALNLSLPLDGGSVHVVARGGPVSLSSLGVREGQLGLRDVKRATLAADGVADFSGDFETVELDGKLALRGLLMQRKELSPQPVGPWDFDVSLKAGARLDGTELKIVSSELHFGEVRAELSGVFQSGGEHRHVEGRLRIPLSGCHSVVDAMPSGLMPMVRGMRS
jgi:hypothetical protein